MRLNAEQLPGALAKGLQPLYFISGDEPLQLGEAADAVRAAVRQAGFGVREVIAIEQGNEWPLLAQEAESLSIFADKKLIDLRLPSGKPGVDGGKALAAYCQHPPADTVLLVSAGKIDAASQKSQWFQSIDRVGAVVQVWPLQGGDLLNWLQRRAAAKGMTLDANAAKALAMRIEGNLLAAAQEIEKLYILYGAKLIDGVMIENAVADSTRFDVFNLSDAVLAGKLNRAIKVLRGLQAEGVAAPVVLWGLSREARTLLGIKTELNRGGQLDSLFKKYQVWDKRKQRVQDALRRHSAAHLQQVLLLCARADRQIKGQQTGDAWDGLFEICVALCNPRLAG